MSKQFMCETCGKIFKHKQVTKMKRHCETCCRKNHILSTMRCLGLKTKKSEPDMKKVFGYDEVSVLI